MVYQWEPHQEICYRLYIQEGKPLEDLMDLLKNVHKFAPRRWKFPLKLRSLHDDERIVSRIKELWEKNLGQGEMLRVLNEEDGFDIKLRELMRLRAKHRLLMRMPKGDSPGDTENDHYEGREPHNSRSELAQEFHLLCEEAPTKVSRRSQRRRTDGEASQNGSTVRYPSETTLDEARVIMNLNMTRYRALRSHFQQICEDQGIIKKTVAGAEKWDEAKENLILQMPELHSAWAVKGKLESHRVALDVICTDVTKRMRIIEAKMSLAQAKNLLGINPEQFRQMRSVFFQILGEAGLTRKSNATPQQWESLKRAWANQSPHLKPVYANMNEKQGRALEILAKDILKRLRDGRLRKELQAGKKSRRQHNSGEESEADGTCDETVKPPQPQGSSSAPAASAVSGRRHYRTRSRQHRQQDNDDVDVGAGISSRNFDTTSEVSHMPQINFSPRSSNMGAHLPISLHSQTSATSTSQGGLAHTPRVLRASSMAAGMSLEPHMGSSLLLGSNGQGAFMHQPFVQSQLAPTGASTPVYQQVHSSSSACAIFMRLHPSSSFVSSQNIWISTLSSNSVQEVRQRATEKFPGTMCIRLEGIVKDGKGGELPLPIDQDEELSAYISHLQGAAPTFNVQLV